MTKTIKRAKDMTFRDLMKYILDNDIKDKDFRCVDDDRSFRVCANGRFDFYDKHYNICEIYEVEVEEEITEDTEFECVVINTEHYIYSFRYISIKESRDKLPKAVEIFARIDGRLQLVWERDED